MRGQTVQAVNAAVAKLLKDPVILERLDKQGVVKISGARID